MLALAWSTVRGRTGGFVAAFVAVLFGSAVITACGILLESSERSKVPTERYRAAELVVGARQAMPVADDVDPRFVERATLPADRIADVARVPGVRAAIADVSVAVSLVTADGAVLGDAATRGHGWGSTVLGPFTMSAGRPPTAFDDVVLDAALAERAGVPVDGTVRLAVGSTVATFRVSGVVRLPDGRASRQPAVFFADERVRALSGRADRVAVIGVLLLPGAGVEEVADAIRAAVPDVVVYQGRERSEAEFLDLGGTRSFVSELALAFGGSMVLVIMIVVGSTLALSVRQRLRELALLRAIGATPKQVLRMITAETMVVGTLGAVLGVVPGIGLSLAFRAAFVAVGAIPADFTLSIGPLPVLVSVVLCLIGARLGSWVAARRAARLRPVDALGEAVLEPPRLGRLRLTVGVLLIPAGLAMASVPPLRLRGEGAAESAAFSAFLLIFAVGLLGPKLLAGAVTVLGPWLNPGAGVSGFLATANAHANARRLAAATTPLIMGITLAAGQLFSGTTASAAAQDQAADALRADFVVTSASAGVSPELADTLRRVPGVAVVTPVVRTRTLVTFRSGEDVQFRHYAAQGITADRLTTTLDPGVLDGDLDALRGDTVALSRIAAGTLDVALGDTVTLRLGDGTPVTPTVVAIYERGLGLGDVTLPHDVVLTHTTDRLDLAVLVAAAPGADVGVVGAALRSAVAGLPTVRVSDRAAFVGAQREAAAGESAVGLILNAVLLGYLAIAVVNTLVMATAARFREFALLRLVGATRRQVRAMMRSETRIIVVTAVLIGTLAAIPSLVGTSLALTRTLLPAVPPLAYLGIVGVAALLGWAAVMTSARIAMRPRPVEAIGVRE
ncbi:FtsX-like permease family protein [Dactylosporangium aurantiacum]|uniref:FtsX-like permease family protein n=1 Tax=Dactylosporangium aurantiacum TaxID=35754 RepID=A0A9Q9MKW2_9ACTN|nr:FtsX-like permease family protein [Dactylosporangium aurantiacum]MDG6110268.1 ABC transporter permease [Dactylosporangium aurantiacum]UWZ58360.1 FtsX-like permease family protein [Dactylosporangium aurantiacum]